MDPIFCWATALFFIIIMATHDLDVAKYANRIVQIPDELIL